MGGDFLVLVTMPDRFELFHHFLQLPIDTVKIVSVILKCTLSSLGESGNFLVRGLYESSMVLVAHRILRLKRSVWKQCIINQNPFVSHRDIRFVPVFVRESADDGSIFGDGGSSGWVSFLSVDVTTYFFKHPVSVKLCIPN